MTVYGLISPHLCHNLLLSSEERCLCLLSHLCNSLCILLNLQGQESMWLTPMKSINDQRLFGALLSKARRAPV